MTIITRGEDEGTDETGLNLLIPGRKCVSYSVCNTMNRFTVVTTREREKKEERKNALDVCLALR